MENKIPTRSDIYQFPNGYFDSLSALYIPKEFLPDEGSAILKTKKIAIKELGGEVPSEFKMRTRCAFAMLIMPFDTWFRAYFYVWRALRNSVKRHQEEEKQYSLEFSAKCAIAVANAASAVVEIVRIVFAESMICYSALKGVFLWDSCRALAEIEYILYAMSYEDTFYQIHSDPPELDGTPPRNVKASPALRPQLSRSSSAPTFLEGLSEATPTSMPRKEEEITLTDHIIKFFMLAEHCTISPLTLAGFRVHHWLYRDLCNKSSLP
ncbi:MAG: hypothetical protein K9M07_00815 [Simkaniaceae bacterium]|nr:hypothetical protein [Simkaniaceae bacterium]